MLHPRPGGAMRSGKKYRLIIMHKIAMELIPHEKAQIICSILNHCPMEAVHSGRIPIKMVRPEMLLSP
jgi:hypothetical protein